MTSRGDSLAGQRKEGWRAQAPVNEPDETGGPIVRPRLTLDSGLNLRVEEDRLTRDAPPTYEWQLGDIAEVPQPDTWGWDAFVVPRSQAAVTPGYDVSRSFDRTIFWGEGRQTMTVAVTLRELRRGVAENPHHGSHQQGRSFCRCRRPSLLWHQQGGGTANCCGAPYAGYGCNCGCSYARRSTAVLSPDAAGSGIAERSAMRTHLVS